MCLMEALFAVSKRQKIKMSGPDIASTTAAPCSDEKWSTATKIAAEHFVFVATLGRKQQLWLMAIRVPVDLKLYGFARAEVD